MASFNTGWAVKQMIFHFVLETVSYCVSPISKLSAVYIKVLQQWRLNQVVN